MKYEVKILYPSNTNWEDRILLINENDFQIEYKSKMGKTQTKTYLLSYASIIENYKNDLDKEDSIFIGTHLYNMIIKPKNEEDKINILKSFEKISNNTESLNKIKEEKKEDIDISFQKLSEKLHILKQDFNKLLNCFEDKKENNDINKDIDNFKNVLDETIIRCFKYHNLVADMEYNNLILGDDTSIASIEIIENLNNFPKLYSFKNRPNDIGFKKNNQLSNSVMPRERNASINLINPNINNPTSKSVLVKDDKNIQSTNIYNEFQNNDYIPSKRRMALEKPLTFPPNLVKEIVSNFTKSKSAVPVYFNEPLSMLQKQCERFYYLDLLNKANEEPKPEMRLCYIAAFIIGEIFLNNGRTLKPFNPIIGESYEYFINTYNFRYCAEQVCHKPPVTAFCGENPNFEVYGDTLGNHSFKFFKGCMELTFTNKIHIKLKKTGDHYTYTPPNTLAKGIMNPPMYVDYSGDVLIENLTDKKYKCELKFIAEGWSKDSLGNFEGTVYNGDDVVYLLGGNWKENIYMTDPDGNNEKQLLVLDQNLEYLNNNSERYILPEFVADLNNLTEELEKSLPLNDCRFKKDQRFLEEGNITEAQKYKEKYEEKQRKELNNDEHKILFFNKKYDEESEVNYYEPNGQYWEMKKNNTLKDNVNCNIFDVTNY